MKYKAPRGTHDIWGEQAEKLRTLENKSCEVFKRYNYAELKVPTFEDAELFTRSIGETTDIVEKEMYLFTDRKGRRLALRPEGTASVVRAYLENNLEHTLPVSKFFYTGSMFRYERPQAGRYREFFQIGAEYFNNPHPSADAEVILLAQDILEAAGLKDIEIHINSLGCSECRPLYKKELLSFFTDKEDVCDDCKRRIEKNPLRILDCKIDGPKFKNAPKMNDILCPACKRNFEEVLALLDKTKCKYVYNPNLVRGLDYYTRTVFEVKSKGLGSQDALAAGGRYDNLVQELGGPAVPAVGFALGSERVVLATDTLGFPIKSTAFPLIFVAVLDDMLAPEAFAIADALKKKGRTVEGPFCGKSLKSQMRLADKLNAQKVIIIAETEYRKGVVLVKDMFTKEQNEVALDAVTSGLFS